ncbi:MAG: diguanylate cyclase, partial [Perlucidibaca sp.]
MRELLMQKFMRLRFPDRLEHELRERMLRRGVTTLREYYWLLFMLMGAFALALFLQFSVNGIWIGPLEDLRVLNYVIGFSGLGILFITLCGRVTMLDRYYHAYVMPVATIILVMLALLQALFIDESLRQRSGYAVTYVLLIIYGLANMPLGRAVLIGLGSMGLSALIISQLDMRFDWTLFLQTFLLTNLVGIGNGYVLEVRERRLFLQSRLIELEKRQLNRLSERLVQLSREDGLTGLANRRHFNDSFMLEWERARREKHPLALVFV